MSKKTGFFAAPNLENEESIIKPNEETANKANTSVSSKKKATDSFFFPSDLDGNPVSVQPQKDDSERSGAAWKNSDTVRRKPSKGKKIYPPMVAENYPWFERREFVDTKLRTDPYVIEKLPEIGATPTINWLQILAGPVAMLALALILMPLGVGMIMMIPMQLVALPQALFGACWRADLCAPPSTSPVMAIRTWTPTWHCPVWISPWWRWNKWSWFRSRRPLMRVSPP